MQAMRGQMKPGAMPGAVCCRCGVVVGLLCHPIAHQRGAEVTVNGDVPDGSFSGTVGNASIPLQVLSS